jgi:hypothetical protein
VPRRLLPKSVTVVDMFVKETYFFGMEIQGASLPLCFFAPDYEILGEKIVATYKGKYRLYNAK